MFRGLVKYLDDAEERIVRFKRRLMDQDAYVVSRSASPRRGEICYDISVNDSDKDCILGQRFTSTLLFGVPMPRYMRPFPTAVLRFPKLLGSRFAVYVISESHGWESVRQSDGIILVFDLLSPESFSKMTDKLWRIIETVKLQQRPNNETNVIPTIFIVGYQGPGAWARRLTDAHIQQLVESSKARYFEINHFDQGEIACIAFQLAHDIHQSIAQQTELKRTSVPYASLPEA